MVKVCEDKKFTNEKGEKVNGFYMDELLKKNLDFEIARVKKKWDCMILIDGQEGAAKTTLGSAIAKYISSQFVVSQ